MLPYIFLSKILQNTNKELTNIKNDILFCSDKCRY